jgi:hypothetical protein
MQESGSLRTRQFGNMAELAFEHHTVYRLSEPLFPNAKLVEACIQLFQNVGLHSRRMAQYEVPRKTLQRSLIFGIPLLDLTDFPSNLIAAATQTLGLYRAPLGLAVPTQRLLHRPYVPPSGPKFQHRQECKRLALNEVRSG